MATNKQKEILKSKGQEKITIVRYIDSTKEIVVEKGLKLEYELNGYFGKKEVIEKIVCKRKGTKKYIQLTEDLASIHNAFIVI